MNNPKTSELSDEELRIKVAELCGWTNIREQDYYIGYQERDDDIRQFWQGVNPHTKEKEPIPNYPADLNAMHEAEATLGMDQQTNFWYALIEATTGFNRDDFDTRNELSCFEVANATARQRAEAFVSTMSPVQQAGQRSTASELSAGAQGNRDE